MNTPNPSSLQGADPQEGMSQEGMRPLTEKESSILQETLLRTAKREPTRDQHGEIPEEIESVLKNLARSGWQFSRNAHRLYPDNIHTFSDYSATALPKDLEPAIACYHKMQEEIKEYRKALGEIQGICGTITKPLHFSQHTPELISNVVKAALTKYPQGKEGGK